LTTEQIIKMGYEKPRQLPDGTWCALYRMIYTVGVIVDITEIFYGHRFCYKHYENAEQALLSMSHIDDDPIGYIKRKPEL